MPSIELSDDELSYLRIVMATLLLQCTSPNKPLGIGNITLIVAINEALKNAKH